MIKHATTVLIAALAVLALSCLPAAAQSGPTVSVVRVELEIANPQPPEPVREKIAYTVQQVGLKALQGKSLEDAEDIKPDLAPVLEKIFNQVLSGYKVSSMDIGVGEETHIRLAVEPVGPFTGPIEVSAVFEGGTHPVWEKLLEEQTGEAAARFNTAAQGVPVSSAAWAAKAIEPTLDDPALFGRLFPGFQVTPRLEISETPKLILNLSAPKESTIRLANLKLRSSTIPSLAIERLKYDAASRLDILIGLPILFAQVNKSRIAAELESFIEEGELARTLHLEADVRIQPGRTARVSIIIESSRYSGFVRANVGVGKDDRNPEIEAHAGMFVLGNFEAFTEFNFYPGPIDLLSNAGVGYRLSPYFYAAFGRNFTDGVNRAWANAYLTEDIVLFFKKGFTDDKEHDIECGITLKAHEFFSFGISSDLNNDIWLALTTNL